jgi:hypothetical protein
MLNRKVSITVPGTNHGQLSPISQDSAVEDALASFSRFFGGATAVNGRGAWVNAAGELVVEPVVVVYSYCDDESLAKHRAGIYTLAEQMASDLGQECVALELPEGMDFVSPKQVVLHAA